MVWLLKKSFSFVSPYSLKECKKALKSIETQQENMTLLEFVDKTDESYVRVERRYVVHGRSRAYAEAEVWLHLNEAGAVDVRGYSRVLALQLVLYLYFILASAFFAFVVRSAPLLSLYIGLFAFLVARWMRWIFLNRERLILTIYDILGDGDAASRMTVRQVTEEQPLDGEDVLPDAISQKSRERL